MRRMNRWNVSMVLLLIAGLTCVSLFMHGCSTPGTLTGNLNPTPDRSRRLMALAAEEAAAIPDVDARLTRQLNLADLQIQRGWQDDARVTLAAARATLASADAAKLNDHARISGWISVSELSRTVDDTVGATKACEGAIAAMNAIADPAVRCDYVMGISNELQYLKGPEAAARMLAAAGPWTKSIDDVARRRQAVVSFAAALFNLDDYAAGQKLLRNEDDPAWRSDTLTRFASLPVQRDSLKAAPGFREPQATSPAADESFNPTPYYGKTLRFRDVFQNQQRSQTK
jgi:hypothetical protein